MPANPTVVPVSEYVLITLALAVFAIIGWRRGVNCELVTFAAVLIALAAASLLSEPLVPVVNRMARILRFALSGGMNNGNPTAAWDAVNQLPDMVNSPASKAGLELVVFMIPIGISYLVGLRVRPATNFGQRVLGSLMGGVSGFFIAQHFVPILFPSGETRIELATGPASSLLQNTQVVAVLVVVVVVILVAFGLFSSRRVIKK